LDAACTILVPTMANDAFSIPAPADDRPAQNGIDYDAADALAARSPWPGLSDIYHHTRTETDPGLGATSAYVAARPDRIRCRLPAGSFSALGPLAGPLMAAETEEDVFGPLRALETHQGWVLLIGVTLTRMTVLHLAEVRAGRRPFIRWARGPDGDPVRCRGGECSEGFDNLAPIIDPIGRAAMVGRSLWRAFPASTLLHVAALAIIANPHITHCSDRACIECADAIAGGPLDSL
jgi:aminoglycoside 3-N-acetyltransferase